MWTPSVISDGPREVASLSVITYGLREVATWAEARTCHPELNDSSSPKTHIHPDKNLGPSPGMTPIGADGPSNLGFLSN